VRIRFGSRIYDCRLAWIWSACLLKGDSNETYYPDGCFVVGWEGHADWFCGVPRELDLRAVSEP
jgi:hypothetical protein